jgi:parallel beta-helix repeat protein
MGMNAVETSTSLAKGISEERPSFFSISTYLLFWMLLVALGIGFAFDRLAPLLTKAIQNPEITLLPTMTLSEIQEKIDRAKSGTTLLLAKGVYHGSLILKDKSKLFLKGEEGTKIRHNGRLLQIHNCHEIKIHNIEFEGISPDPHEGIISISQGSAQEFQNLRFSGTMIGMSLFHTDQIRIESCEFSGLRMGVFIESSKQILIQNSKFYENLDVGIKLVKEAELFAYQNVIQRNNVGILANDSRITLSEKNQIKENSSGVSLISCNNSELDSNTIEKNSNHGVFLEKCLLIKIIQNAFTENQSTGIYLNESSAEIRGNSLKKNSKGIVFQGRTVKVTLINNSIQENVLCGIHIQRTAKEALPPPEKLRELNLFENNQNSDILVD